MESASEQIVSLEQGRSALARDVADAALAAAAAARRHDEVASDSCSIDSPPDVSAIHGATHVDSNSEASATPQRRGSTRAALAPAASRHMTALQHRRRELAAAGVARSITSVGGLEGLGLVAYLADRDPTPSKCWTGIFLLRLATGAACPPDTGPSPEVVRRSSSRAPCSRSAAKANWSSQIQPVKTRATVRVSAVPEHGRWRGIAALFAAQHLQCIPRKEPPPPGKPFGGLLLLHHAATADLSHRGEGVGALMAARRPFLKHEGLQQLHSAAVALHLLRPAQLPFSPCPSRFNKDALRRGDGPGGTHSRSSQRGATATGAQLPPLRAPFTGLALDGGGASQGPPQQRGERQRRRCPDSAALADAMARIEGRIEGRAPRPTPATTSALLRTLNRFEVELVAHEVRESSTAASGAGGCGGAARRGSASAKKREQKMVRRRLRASGSFRK